MSYEQQYQQYRIEKHNLDGSGSRRVRVYDMLPVAAEEIPQPPEIVVTGYQCGHPITDPTWCAECGDEPIAITITRPIAPKIRWDYWAAVTDVDCPICGHGVIRWHEAGYVPGYRRCDGCRRDFLAQGSAERPTLLRLTGSGVGSSKSEGASMKDKNYCLDCGLTTYTVWQPYRGVWLCKKCWGIDMAPDQDSDSQ